jgi:guanylate kinase
VTDGAGPDGVEPDGGPAAGPSRLTVLAGPTAVGKGTVAAAVRDGHPEVWISVSATTRRPRPDEVDGTHYHFVTDAEFDEMVATDALLEWAVVHGVARYGTPRRPVEEALAAGRPALLEIDLQGARQVRATMPGALFVFLKPPSWDELVRRLVGRGTESDEERRRRLDTAVRELAAESEFDVTIVNREVHDAADELVRLMTAPRPWPVETSSALPACPIRSPT